MSREHRRSTIPNLLLIAALVGAVSCDSLNDPAASGGPAAVLAPEAASLRSLGDAAIPDRYVVVLDDDATDPRGVAAGLVGAAGGELHHVYEHALKGFSMKVPAQALAGIRNHPAVAYVAEDGLAHPIGPASAVAAGTQTDATWGLDRVDQRDRPLDGTYTFGPTGAGVTAYVIDSGIMPTHEEFGDRARIGTDFVGDGQEGVDCNGHGTHVAGTIGGSTYGVAKDVDLVAVRVFACEGGAPFSVIIAAVDWVTANATRPAVVNMSLGGSAFDPLDDAVRGSIAAGLTYSLAAGNAIGADACMFSPARTAEALTVGSTTASDARSAFSNVGPCLDLFAPGSAITSAWHTGAADIRTISGTSMAAPHVAGVAALYLEGDPSASPDAVASAILGSATAGRIADVGEGSPDLLLFSPLTPPADGPVIGLQPSKIRFNVLVAEDGGELTVTAADASATTFDVSAGGPFADKTEAGESVSSATASQPVRLSNLGNEAMTWAATSDAAWLDVDPLGGSVEAGDGTDLVVTTDPAGLPAGFHDGSIAIEAPGALNTPRAIDVTLAIMPVVDLESGVPVTDLAGATGSERLFRIQVPEGTAMLRVETFGGVGDLDLLVRYADVPERVRGGFDCGSGNPDNHEFCAIGGPPPGDWFILLHGWAEYEGATLVATVEEAAPVIDLWPPELRFQRLIDPATGAPIAAAAPTSRATREDREAGRLMESGKTYPGVRADDVGPASTATSQPIWLGNVGVGTLNWTAGTDQSWLAVSPAEGALEPWDFTELIASVDPGSLGLGDHHGAIIVEDPAAQNSPAFVAVTLSISVLETIELGVPAENLSGSQGSFRYFRVTVPEGLPVLEVTTTGGSGDADLFVRHGAPPDLMEWMVDCVSASFDNEERCTFQNPPAGDWYILLHAWNAYEGLTLRAAEGVPSPIMELSPPFLVFQRLVDPTTGGLVAPAPPTARPDAVQLEAARTLGGKVYQGVGRSDASPASFAATQPVWLANIGAAPLEWTAASDRPWLDVGPMAGVLEPGEATELAAAVDAAGLTAGYHSGTVTVADPAAFNSPQMVWVDLFVSLLRPLELGVPLEDLSGDWLSGPQYFRVTVPAGATDLEIRTAGGSGDLDLFVRHGSPPDLWWWEFDCASFNFANDEICSFPEPAGGDWYVLIYPFQPFEGATLVATATIPWTLERLAAEIDALHADGVIGPGAAASLGATVAAATVARDRSDLRTVAELLQAFIDEVRALERSRLVDPATAAALVEAAEELLAELGG